MDLAQLASDLADAVAASLEGWIVGCVERGLAESGIAVDAAILETARSAGAKAAEDVVPRLRRLLDADIDAQSTTPLALVRQAVPYATAVLRQLNVPPVARDEFAKRHFPDDIYDLTPANLGALGEATGQLALEWGAAKAWEHKRRHRS